MVPPEQLITAIEHLRIITYFVACSTALLVFDYFLTFPLEVSLIWSARWTPTKVLFFLSRYLPFVDIAFALSSHLQSWKPETCLFFYRTMGWLYYVGTALPAIILTLRTWAVWDGGRLLSIGLIVFFAICWGPIIPIIIIYNKSLEFTPISLPPLLGCLAIRGSRIMVLCWVLAMIYEFGIFLLMLLKAMQCYRRGGMSGLSLVVYRDGLLYYLYLFCFAFANVIMVGALPPDLQVVLVLTERIMHSILGCRVVLGMKNYVSSQHVNTSPYQAHTLTVLSRHDALSSGVGSNGKRTLQ